MPRGCALERAGEVLPPEPAEALFHLPGGAPDDGQRPQVLPSAATNLIDDLYQSLWGRLLDFLLCGLDQELVGGQEMTAPRPTQVGQHGPVGGRGVAGDPHERVVQEPRRPAT